MMVLNLIAAPNAAWIGVLPLGIGREFCLWGTGRVLLMSIGCCRWSDLRAVSGNGKLFFGSNQHVFV